MNHEFHSYYYDSFGKEPITDDVRLPDGAELDEKLLYDMITEHREKHAPRLLLLKHAYEGRAEVFGGKHKDSPDNRLAADFPKYIADTFDGYFLGAPVEMKIPDDTKQMWLRDYNIRNQQDDVDAELAKNCSVCGCAYEMLYQDEEGKPRSAAIDPVTCFIVVDSSVAKRPLYSVRYYNDEDGTLHGELSDSATVKTFYEDSGVLVFDSEQSHAFGGVPIIKYRQNAECRGVYEGVLNLIQAYNKALSEKSNDVDYFADCYMKVTGQQLDDDEIRDMRQNRVINIWGEDALDAEFMAKPSADTTQENFLNRLDSLIFKLAMVPDIQNESFGTASGIALKMRLLPMANLATTKERKFKASIRERLHLLANYPNQPFSADDWMAVELTMTRNMPDDLASEAQIAAQLVGIVSRETQLSILSCVDDVQAEIARLDEDTDPYGEGWPVMRTGEGGTDESDVQGDQEAGSAE